MKLWAVFAHPDDEVLCAAGTLALAALRGDEVSLLCATRGEYGPIASEALATPETLASVREGELRASCAALGVARVDFLDLPDAGVDWAADDAGTAQQLATRLQRERPDVLITFGPDGLYGHPDHVAIGALCLEACSLAHVAPRVFYPVWTHGFVRELLAALPGSQLWSLPPEQFPLEESAITARVDVQSVLERKLRAIHSHRTQLTENHALAQLDGELAARFLGVECFRSADGSVGGPLP